MCELQRKCKEISGCDVPCRLTKCGPVREQCTCCWSSPVLCRERRLFTWLTCFSWTSCGSMVSTCWQAPGSRKNTRNTADTFADMLQSNRSFILSFLFWSNLFVLYVGAALQRSRHNTIWPRHEDSSIWSWTWAARSRRSKFAAPPMTAQPRERAPRCSQKFIIDERKRANRSRERESLCVCVCVCLSVSSCSLRRETCSEERIEAPRL